MTKYIMTYSLLVRYADMILCVILLVFPVVASYFISDIPTSGEVACLYISGIVLGVIITLGYWIITINKTYSIQKTNENRVQNVRWTLLTIIIIIGIILALTFACGYIIPDRGVSYLTELIFMVGELIGVSLIALTLLFDEVHYTAKRAINFLTGKNNQ